MRGFQAALIGEEMAATLANRPRCSILPYNRHIVPHLLRLTDDNYDAAGNQRQLFGFSIAAKRHTLYTTKCGRHLCTHRNCVTIADPKAHGLIFSAPSEEREKR